MSPQRQDLKHYQPSKNRHNPGKRHLQEETSAQTSEAPSRKLNAEQGQTQGNRGERDQPQLSPTTQGWPRHPSHNPAGTYHAQESCQTPTAQGTPANTARLSLPGATAADNDDNAGRKQDHLGQELTTQH